MTQEDKIFEKHYRYYQSIGIETIKQQAGQVEQVSSDYQGRVIYELLQNAFDKADENILVEVIGNSLYIANDGTKFSYNANHDYKDGKSEKEKFKRFDFQSLCSISTSTKNTSESIGNKGVGFKSVFSVAKDGFVNVYTNGLMVNDGEPIDEIISFGIYDSFKDKEAIPSGFELGVRQTIEKQILQVQQERKERGVPGYYYPLHITKEPQTILDYFEKGYVTVIEIPFDSLDKIAPLYEDIKKIHFNFVSLKYDKPFQIDFIINGSSFKKKIITNDGLFFSTTIKSEAIEQLAKDAGVLIGDDNKVALCFKLPSEIKQGEKGLLYNYLPTEEESPFKYVDFHADFHTTVDRKSIDFNHNSEIGKYNSALLKACIELYFTVLNNHLPFDKRVSIQIDNINEAANIKGLNNFQWDLLDIGECYHAFPHVRSALRIWNKREYDYSYKVASELLTELASCFFYVKKIEEQYSKFFNITKAFIKYFSRDDGQEHKWINYFKKDFVGLLINKEVQVIPEAKIGKGKELLFRDKKEEHVKLPDFLGIDVTSFNIGDDFFKQKLGINNYSDINVLFKYFRQVGINGNVSNDPPLSEQKQIALLKSLFELFESKTEVITSFAHRYHSFMNTKDREKKSPQNITNFSVSTVFLKTKLGKYKPAQLCNGNELDDEFVRNFVSDENRDTFLKFLGVSDEINYLVVDKNIFDKLKKGIDFIPTVFSKDEASNLLAKEIIPSIRVVFKDKELHPALINYNNYRFLDDISNSNIKKQLYPLNIGVYKYFPDYFTDVLLENIKKNIDKFPHHVFILYSANLFHLLEKRKEYLVINSGRYKWTKKTNFKIACNRNDFALLKDQPINLLCFFNGNEIPDDLNENKIELKPLGVSLNNEKDITILFKKEYERYIPYMLAEISYLSSSISERDYIKELSDVKKFQDFWNKISVKTGDKLKAKYKYDNDFEPIYISQTSCFSDDNSTLYIDNSITKGHKSKAIAEHIFNVSSLYSKIELVFFYKDIEDLYQEYNRSDIELIASKWLPNYEDKYKAFQIEILSHFDFDPQSEINWYVYNESNPSELIIRLDRENRINELIQVVDDCKQKEEYKEYFKNFQIEIDRSHIENKIGELLIVLEKNSNDKELIVELNQLYLRLGVEDRLIELEKIIKEHYPASNQEGIINQETSEKSKELALKNKVETIFNKLPNLVQKSVNTIDLRGNHITKQIPIKAKKIIFKGQELLNSKILETMGASGEEEVLLFFINEFIAIKDIELRKNAINEVYELLEKKVGDTSHKKHKEECLKVVNDDAALQKALIPFFYVTMHHKFSYFDLIAYYDDKPTLVEVKTTNKNKSFYLSIAEVNVARSGDNYLIVRNSSDSINLLGNPIKDIEKKISFIEGDKFSLKPRNYEFKLEK